jgi:hypothetical protein
MVEVTPLTATDIAAIKPKYQPLPPTWTPLGSRGFISKRGTPFTIVDFLTDENTRVGFFAEKIAKDDKGNLFVELSHYGEQIARADAYAKK